MGSEEYAQSWLLSVIRAIYVLGYEDNINDYTYVGKKLKDNAQRVLGFATTQGLGSAIIYLVSRAGRNCLESFFKNYYRETDLEQIIHSLREREGLDGCGGDFDDKLSSAILFFYLVKLVESVTGEKLGESEHVDDVLSKMLGILSKEGVQREVIELNSDCWLMFAKKVSEAYF